MPADSRDMVLVSRDVVDRALYAMARGYERLHSLPRITDTVLADQLEAAKVALRDAALSASPARGERDAPSRWSAVRNLFVRHAEAFNKATRYEEASAIADKAGREIEELFAPSTTSTAEQVDAPRDEQGRDAYQIIADCNREAMMRRAGARDRSRDPLFGPPNDMAVSRVLLAERPDFDPEEADRLAVKINDALSALIAPSPGEGDAPVTWLDRDYDWDAISDSKKRDYEKAGYSMERYNRPCYLRPTPATPAGEELREKVARIVCRIVRTYQNHEWPEGYTMDMEVENAWDDWLPEADAILAALQPQAEGEKG